jgi:hypothetical protein
MIRQNSLFPPSPRHGTIFELTSGLFFKYDATVNSWIRITANNTAIALATPVDDGAMAAVDLKKLNRLVLPPPVSSIIGTDCLAPFHAGTIGFYAGDKMLGVDGSVNVENIGPYGEVVQKRMPFQIHQHTYGFDFTIDLPELVEELKLRKKFNLLGKKGSVGFKGDTGPAGPDHILTGPPGNDGEEGTAPPCQFSVDEDSLSAEPHEGMTKALVSAKAIADPNDPTKFKLVVERQMVGPVGFAADRFHVDDETSPWVLVITGTDDDTGDVPGSTAVSVCNDQQIHAGKPQNIFYIDIEPMIDTIHQRFLRETEILRAGYQDIVRFWIQVMSDLFDEQKQALCCSLEHCLSISRGIEAREHMENVAAAASGSANILLHGRDSKEASIISSTRILKQLKEGEDVCRGGPRFPLFPNVKGGGVGGFGPDGSTPHDPGGPGKAPLTPVDPAPHGRSQSQNVASAVKEEAVQDAVIVVDPLLHSSAKTGIQVLFHPGDYIAVIQTTDAQANGRHRSNVKIQHFNRGVRRSVQFLDKGSFDSVVDAKHAYEGLTLSFHHDGGYLSLWLPLVTPPAAGSVTVAVAPAYSTPPQEVIANPAPVKQELPSRSQDETPHTCQLSLSHLAWYEKGWNTGNCCGLVVNVMGQDYIVVKRSLGAESSCGGGESETTPCIAKFLHKGHPAFAWPTFDGKTFAPLPQREAVGFRYDEKLNEVVARKINDSEFESGKGNPPGVRHLSFQLMMILFPTMT